MAPVINLSTGCTIRVKKELYNILHENRLHICYFFAYNFRHQSCVWRICNSMKINKYLAFFLVLLCGMASRAALAGEMLKIEVSANQEIVTLNVPDTDGYKVFILPNPDRLVVDVPTIAAKPTVNLPAAYKGDIIKSVRFAQFNPTTSRFVFDLEGPIKVQNTEAQEDPTALIIEIAPKSGGKDIKAGGKNKKAKKPSKPIVVIDAGHGGQDPGTNGPKGTYEKNIVLEYAKALRAKLTKSGKYYVTLTREDDEFIMLRRRVDIARKANGTIFISLHADSAPDKAARGLSVYTVSEKASDIEAEALAARENKADVLSGMDLSEERKDVADILISLAQRETKNRSATLADFLVARLEDKVKLLENTHRFAGFAVLKAPDIPSVLIEIGFLSHPAEEKLLTSKAYREKVISGIANGIDAYFAHQKASEGE